MRGSAVVVLLLFIALVNVEGKGGRGGGSRGGSRSSGRGSGVGARVSSYRGPVYSRSSWKTAAAVGTLYGLSHYKSRRLYLSHPDREPNVCFNTLNLRNGTYGYFICPEPDLPDDKDHCCGENGDQRCCTKEEYEKEQLIGAIVGGVIGGLILVGVVVFLVWFCYFRNRRQRRAATGGKVLYSGQTVTTTTTTPGFANNVYSTPVDYGVSNPGHVYDELNTATTGATSGEDTKIPPANDNLPPYQPYDSEPRRRSPTSDPPQYGFKDAASAPSYDASANYPTSPPQPQPPQPPPYSTLA